jgi:hypothetical protein
MSKNNVEFVLVTFFYDLAQFYMLCLSIKKYHNKNYKIRIVYNYDDKTELVAVDDFLKIINEHLFDFNVEFIIKPSVFNGVGWDTQQLLKWYLAYTSTVEWQVVLDSKNFYIKSFDLLDTLDFKEIPGFAFPEEDKWIQQELDKSFKFLESYQPEYPQKYSAMTPWIWNTNKIKEMLDTVWPNCSWKRLKKLPGTEWFLYLSWIGKDIKYYPCQLVNGIWGNTDTNISLDPIMFTDRSDVYFWTHHRFGTSDVPVAITESIIRKSNIATDIEIGLWKYYLNMNATVD